MTRPQNEIDNHAPPQSFRQDVPRQHEPARLGPLERLMGTLISPGETFEDINRKPSWVVPILISIIASVAFSFFFEWRVKPDWNRIVRAQVRRAIEARGGQMPPEEVIQQQVALSKTIGKIAPAVIPPIFTLILAGIFALGLMLMAAQTTFSRILSVVAWTGAAIGLLNYLVIAASLMLRNRESLDTLDPTQPGGFVPTNLAVILPATTAAPIRVVAAQFDVFTIWFLILLTIGFAAIAGSRRITTAKTATLVFGLWIVFIIVRAGWAAVVGM